MTEITIEQLYDFKTCPLQYKFTNIDKLPRLKTEESKGLREVMLATISYYYVNLHEGKFLTLSQLKDKFTGLWYDKDKIYKIKFDQKQSQRKKELEAFSMLALFHRQQQYNPDKTVGVNVDFRLKIDPDFHIVGRIPVIRETPGGKHEIVNFQTRAQRPTEFYQRTDMGITLQALAFHSMYRKEVDTYVLHHLKTSQSIYVDRKRADYQRLYKSARMLKKSMDEGWYYPREGFHCDSCPTQKYCMEWR
ncbi:PD-(D/E)XK nuclease family protein (plasmid) [Paenibacillus urinalis]|uniref:PD-(D/E)XK nuclease family protein n=1 Tax=Paenibacillus urinalis TaxID=521520 RepID=A0ABY7XH17_9BACL|nr:PD-(D/E)XK nuclease family protein [Paenibacillus urinalis]WDI05063.1 PD-(D/E)XK nuclease family protein [Paenibacillus urinalis]